MSLADKLTWSRLLLGPLAFGLIVAGGWEAAGTSGSKFLAAALLVSILGDLTDLFDGIAARRLGGGTEAGKLADPFTDSVFRLSVYLGLTTVGYFPAWGFLLLLLRDSSNGYLRQISALRGTALAARWSGKVKAWVQGIGGYVILLDMMFGFLWPAFRAGGCAFIAFYTFGSGIDYFWANRQVLETPESEGS